MLLVVIAGVLLFAHGTDTAHRAAVYRLASNRRRHRRGFYHRRDSRSSFTIAVLPIWPSVFDDPTPRRSRPHPPIGIRSHSG